MLYPALVVWAGICALQDASQKRIANSLTFPCMAVALGYLLIRGETLTGASPSQAITAISVVFLLLLPGYMLGRTGAGDIKMMLGLALASDALHVLICIVIAGVGVGIWALLSARVWSFIPVNMKTFMQYMAPGGNDGIPYAPFLFLGFCFASGWIGLL
ncbi:prepilin peptidase [Zobellella maritima]|uniref:prepilin peptidase n=1 Tax=Zobellella maritima TaxID=2059725 RepID=UPI000E3036F6|nr:prepilin peptidase [Zobellella maritima]